MATISDAMHGTCIDRATRIMDSGFPVPKGDEKNNRLGVGVYFFHMHQAFELARRWACDERGYANDWAVLNGFIECPDSACLDLWIKEWLVLYDRTKARLTEFVLRGESQKEVTPHDVINFLGRDEAMLKIDVVVVPEGLPPRRMIPPTRDASASSVVVVRDIERIKSYYIQAQAA